MCRILLFLCIHVRWLVFQTSSNLFNFPLNQGRLNCFSLMIQETKILEICVENKFAEMCKKMQACADYSNGSKGKRTVLKKSNSTTLIN